MKARRATIVTDRNSPTVCITAQVSRPFHTEFERLAHELGLTKAALMRQLVADYVRVRVPELRGKDA